MSSSQVRRSPACSDGSGTISIAWEPNHDDRWMIVGGSGGYADLVGGGRIEAIGDAGDEGSLFRLVGGVSRG